MTIESQVIKLCAQKRDIDDRLGQFSDHEGDKNGPTWSLISNMRCNAYEDHINYQIEQHHAAIKTLRKLLSIKRNHPVHFDKSP